MHNNCNWAQNACDVRVKMYLILGSVLCFQYGHSRGGQFINFGGIEYNFGNVFLYCAHKHVYNNEMYNV